MIANLPIVGSPTDDNVEGAIVFHGARRVPLRTLDKLSRRALDVWDRRANRSLPAEDCFHAADVSCLLIDNRGYPAGYFPNKAENLVVESISRQFLFADGVKSIQNEQPFLLCAAYKVIALVDELHLLVCPFRAQGSFEIGGLVLVNLQLRVSAHLTDGRR